MRQLTMRHVGWALLLGAFVTTAISAPAQDSSDDIRPAPYQVAWQNLISS